MELTMKMTGAAPLVVQGPTLVDPLHPLTKEYQKLTGKRKKTDDDLREIYRIEFYAGLYYDKHLGPYLPGENLEACLRDGAKRTRRGELVRRAVLVLDNEMPLVYPGPRTVDELWKAPEGEFRLLAPIVVNRGSRTMRMRPIFRVWNCEARIDLDTTEMNFEDFREVAETAGRREGLGTWRPRYGRYRVEVVPTLKVSIENGGREKALR